MRLIAVVVAALFCGGLGLAVRSILGGPTLVLPVQPGARLLGLSRGTMYWLGSTCSLWQAHVDGGGVVAPSAPILSVAECPPDDPRFLGDVVFRLGSDFKVRLHTSTEWRVLLARNMAFALAFDGHDVYVGNCAYRGDCRIERVSPNEDAEPVLMQAGIINLANMDVDDGEIFWVDKGRRKPECHYQYIAGETLPVAHCKEPVSPRLMAATKDQPRAFERIVASDFDGTRPFLGAQHVYWLGAGGVYRVRKTGGHKAMALPARALSGFASDGEDVFFASDAGIFQARDGAEARPLQRTSGMPMGLAVDANFVYWIDAEKEAIVRRRRR